MGKKDGKVARYKQLLLYFVKHAAGSDSFQTIPRVFDLNQYIQKVLNSYQSVHILRRVDTMSTEKPRFNYTGQGWEGNNYDNNLGIKDIAKLIRKRLKAKHPQCKFSITIERYSGGQSLNISLMEGPFQAILKQGNIIDNKFVSSQDQGYGEPEASAQLNEYTFNDPYDDIRPKGVAVPGWNNGAQLTREAWDIMHDACKCAVSFNFNDSDGMIDYFHTNFYLHLNIGKWDKPYITT